MYNNIQWLEIPIIDADRAVKFYSNVFKLRFEFIEMPDNKMYMFGETEKIGSPGALVLSKYTKPSINGSTIYFTCDNLEKTIDIAIKSGAEILIGITDIGEFGRYAHILDSEGNRLGLHSNNR